ncbi:MAG: LysM peptidoglycan-binding domain-containing protein [Lachnospiraceae bacterium]|nr:LysM peptidoglycan-binding domain-containing protein [Lachnospiraceae bacterium]
MHIIYYVNQNPKYRSGGDRIMNIPAKRIIKGIICMLAFAAAFIFANTYSAFAADEQYADYKGKMVIILSDPQNDGKEVLDTVEELRKVYEGIGAEVISADVELSDNGDANVNITGDLSAFMGLASGDNDAALLLEKIVAKGFSDVEIIMVEPGEDIEKYYPRTVNEAGDNGETEENTETAEEVTQAGEETQDEEEAEEETQDEEEAGEETQDEEASGEETQDEEEDGEETQDEEAAGEVVQNEEEEETQEELPAVEENENVEETNVEETAETENAAESDDADSDSSASEADELLAQAREEAQAMLDEANDQAEQILDDANKEAEEILSRAGEEAEQIVNNARQEAEQVLNDSKEEAEQIVNDSKEEAEQIVNESREEAEQIVNESREEAEQTVNESREDTDDPGEAVESADADNTYTVSKGDCLWKIAQEKLGDGSRWVEIYELNAGIINNPSLIDIGQVFILPPV